MPELIPLTTQPPALCLRVRLTLQSRNLSLEMVTLVTREGNVIDSMSSRLSKFVPLNLYELYTTLVVHLSNKCAFVFSESLCRMKTQIVLFGLQLRSK